MTKIISLVDIFIGATFDSFDKMAEETMKTYNDNKRYFNCKGGHTSLNCEVNDTSWYMSLLKYTKASESETRLQRFMSLGYLDTGDNMDLPQAATFNNLHAEKVFIYLDDKLSRETVRRIYLHFEEVAVCDSIYFNFVNIDTHKVYGDVAAAALEGFEV